MLQLPPRAFGLVWQASRPGTIAMALITLIAAGLPAAQAWAGKLIVDSVVTALGARLVAAEALRLALPYILLEFGLITASELLSEGRALMHRLLSNRLMHTINLAIMRKALALDLHFFEDATFYDKLQNARHEASWRSLEMVDTCFSLAQNVITLLSFLAILLTFSPLLAMLLLFATLPAFIARIRNSNEFYGFQIGHTPESRRMRYLEHLLTTDSTIKEIKLFNLGEPLLRRYQEMFRSYDSEDMRLARKRARASALWGLEDDQRLAVAAQRGDADEVVAALPQGYETMLGRWFERGHELSGGQWQKLALGRAFMRDGEVLVLDEPTAALDAEHEYEIFQRFRDLTAGKIALLISHRFSTVRMADRIAVLEGGRLTELGTHQELLALDGTYARLFNMQAEGYR